MSTGFDNTNLSKFGLGTLAFGGEDWPFSYGPSSSQAVNETISKAFEFGVNWIDTAASYGSGLSEKIVGQFLKRAKNVPSVMTKCGVFSHLDHEMELARRLDDLRTQAIESKKRLGVHKLDMLLLHRTPVENDSFLECLSQLSEIKAEGVAQRIGLSNVDLKCLELAAKNFDIDAIQIKVSPFNFRESLPISLSAKDKGIQVYAYGLFEHGILTDSFSKNNVINKPRSDVRQHYGNFKGNRLLRNLQIRDSLSAIAHMHGLSVVEALAHWAAFLPSLDGVILGCRNMSQVKELRTPLSGKVMGSAATAIQSAIDKIDIDND